MSEQSERYIVKLSSAGYGCYDVVDTQYRGRDGGRPRNLILRSFFGADDPAANCRDAWDYVETLSRHD